MATDAREKSDQATVCRVPANQPADQAQSGQVVCRQSPGVDEGRVDTIEYKWREDKQDPGNQQRGAKFVQACGGGVVVVVVGVCEEDAGEDAVDAQVCGELVGVVAKGAERGGVEAAMVSGIQFRARRDLRRRAIHAVTPNASAINR